MFYSKISYIASSYSAKQLGLCAIHILIVALTYFYKFEEWSTNNIVTIKGMHIWMQENYEEYDQTQDVRTSSEAYKALGTRSIYH